MTYITESYILLYIILRMLYSLFRISYATESGEPSSENFLHPAYDYLMCSIVYDDVIDSADDGR